MFDASLADIENCDIFIACAAVADYRPVSAAPQKIKKNASQMSIELERNPDIVAAVASHSQRPFTVGFAAETSDLIEYAQGKLARKGLDMIVANDVSGSEAGFNSENNAATILWQGGQESVELTSKQQLARTLISLIARRYRA
jgi:phosphopantothenoylcysteine decarboxylase/phosphopantothenate--cysteine ligase